MIGTEKYLVKNATATPDFLNTIGKIQTKIVAHIYTYTAA